MQWIVIYNTTTVEVVVDEAGREVAPAEFTYADKDTGRVTALLARKFIIEVPITWNPANGNDGSIDPEAFAASVEVFTRNGEDWEPPPTPVTPMTLEQVTDILVNGRLAEEQLIETIIENAPAGGGGGVDEGAVKGIIAETLVAGDGIDLIPDEVASTLEVTSTVGVTTVITPWMEAPLLATFPFDALPAQLVQSGTVTGGANLPVLTTVDASLGANKPVAYDGAMNVPTSSSGVNGSSNLVTLNVQDIPAVNGKIVTKIKFWRSWQEMNGSPTGTILANGVTRVTQGDIASGTATDWVQEEFVGDINTLAFRTSRTSTSPGAGSGWWITGIEVYGTIDPFMLNDVVSYNGQLWRSTQDNNPHTPGSGQGWIAT